MLRNEKFFQRFQVPEPLPVAEQIEAEEVKTLSDGRQVYHTVRHHVLPEVDNTISAEDFDLKILLDSGVQLKPCPPYSSPSLDELSDLNKNLLDEKISQPLNN